MNKSLNIFSFFSGAGFLDLGFELSGCNIVYVSELHSPFMEAYRYSRQQLNLPSPIYGYHEKEEGDIIKLTEGKHKLRLKELIEDSRKNTELTGFIGGPPCPDFSIRGKNRGREGKNGKLSSAYIELICQQQPDFFLFENVKGLWKTKKHRLFFEEMKQRVSEAGYITTERLINALEYGVPQDRDRIILIGFTRKIIGDMGIKVNNEITTLADIFSWNNYIKYPLKKIRSYPWPLSNRFNEDSLLPLPENIPQELTVKYWFDGNDVIKHLNSEHYFRPRSGISRFASVDEGDDSRKSFKRLHRWRYSPTACYGNNEVHLHPYKTRRISVAEALSIQSLPPNFALPQHLSLTNMFKTIGNGVPYLASKGLAQTILGFLEGVKSQ